MRWPRCALAFASAMLVPSCSSSNSAPSAESDAGADAPGASPGTVCLVAGVGGLDDKSFNQTTYAGVKAAKGRFGWDGFAVESSSESDYEPNIQKFVGKCDLIVTSLVDALKNPATQNPKQKFALLDWSLEPALDNVWAQTYATNEAAFMAGYVAAGTTKSGIVATFGGLQTKPVEDFLNGFVLGVTYFNGKNGKSVQALGWDVKTQTGTFAGGWVDKAEGKRIANEFLAQGADIILPVAAELGFGAGDAILVKGGPIYLIGVDSDWTVSAPAYQSIVLTSIIKKLDVSVLNAIDAITRGAFKGGTHESGLASGDVDITGFKDLDALVPESVKRDLRDIIRPGIIDGTIATRP